MAVGPPSSLIDIRRATTCRAHVKALRRSGDGGTGIGGVTRKAIENRALSVAIRGHACNSRPRCGKRLSCSSKISSHGWYELEVSTRMVFKRRMSGPAGITVSPSVCMAYQPSFTWTAVTIWSPLVCLTAPGKSGKAPVESSTVHVILHESVSGTRNRSVTLNIMDSSWSLEYVSMSTSLCLPVIRKSGSAPWSAGRVDDEPLLLCNPAASMTGRSGMSARMGSTVVGVPILPASTGSRVTWPAENTSTNPHIAWVGLGQRVASPAVMAGFESTTDRFPAMRMST